MEYLNEDQKDEIRENNKIINGEFIREEGERNLEKFKKDVSDIRKILKPPSKMDIIDGTLKMLTGLDAISTVAQYGLYPMVKKARARKALKNRMAIFFKRR